MPLFRKGIEPEPIRINLCFDMFQKMGFVKVAILPLSRFFMSVGFLVEGLKTIFSWNETEKALIDHLSNWQVHLVSSQDFQRVFAFFISWSFPLLLFATGAMLLGAVFILMGFKERLGIGLLTVFLIPVTLLYYPFWWVEGPLYEAQAAMFLKNLAILGCLLKLLIRETVAGASPSISFERY